MFCHQCGTRIEDPEDRFCSRCGALLHRGEAEVSPGSEPRAGTPPAERLRRPVSAWPDHGRERVQLPLTELRRRRARETAEPVIPMPLGAAPPPTVTEASEPTVEPEIRTDIETVAPAVEPADTAASRAEAALRRMVPPKEEWEAENRPGEAERASVRDEWVSAPQAGAQPDAPPAEPVRAESPPPAVEDPIIPWLEPPVPVRPVPPSREAKEAAAEGPIVVPRDYAEKDSRQRKGRRRPRARGPLVDPAAIGRAIRPSWILAIAAVILLTLIVFALFPPGGDAAGDDNVNRFTRMPIHTIATPARPTADTPALPAETGVASTAGVPTAADPTGYNLFPLATAPPATTTVIPTTEVATPVVETTVEAAAPAGSTGIRVVIASVGGWSGTIGQQGETYTETPVVGSGNQVRTITGPATMVTVNLQKLDQTTDPLEVRVEQDGIVLKQGVTSEPVGIVALSVQV